MPIGVTVTILTRLCQAQECFFLTQPQLTGLVADLFFQPARPITDDRLLLPKLEQISASCPAFVMVDRLGEEISGTGLQGPILGALVIDAGNDDHRHIDAAGGIAQPLRELDAVHVRHLQVGQHQIVWIVLGPFQGPDRIGERNRFRIVAERADKLLENHPADQLIIDYQHS